MDNYKQQKLQVLLVAIRISFGYSNNHVKTKLLVCFIFVLSCLSAYTQENYWGAEFLDDKHFIENKIYNRFKKSKVYDKHCTYKTQTIPYFHIRSIYHSELSNNQYLSKLTPALYVKKSFGRKMFMFTTFVYSDSSVYYAYDVMNVEPYKVGEAYDFSTNTVAKDVLIKNNFDYLFIITPEIEYIWCIKGNKTVIYSMRDHKFIDFYSFYQTVWRESRPFDFETDIWGPPKLNVK